ncbi:MAG: hypothetical protein HN348_33035 [Proteobacteria bacterium]|jgi:uncharacterized protein YigE (DUF2233 family)|nr:hypothetical protein [Pseudomonadota bacterium]
MSLFLLLVAYGNANPVETTVVTYIDNSYTVVTIDLDQAQMDLVGQADPSLRDLESIHTALEKDKRRLVAALHAGMFHTYDDPVGLHIESGVEYSGLDKSDAQGNFYLKPNGVFVIDSKGARVQATDDYNAQVGEVHLATQSGPMLLLNGEVHPAFNPKSESKYVRGGVCASDSKTVHLVQSYAKVRLHNFATLFRDKLGCRDALYLDGAVARIWTEQEGPPPTASEYCGVLVASVPQSPPKAEDEGDKVEQD